MVALNIHKIGKDDLKYLTAFSKRMFLVLFFILVFVVFFATKGKGINELSVPLYFVPNNGQVDNRVLFYAKAAGYTLWVTKEGLVFDCKKRQVSWLVFRNADRNMHIQPLETTRHRVNYYKGKNSSTWQLKIAAAKAVLYRNIYPYIDLKVYGTGKQVEYDWIVKPGGNPEKIGFSYENVEETLIDEKGNLVVKTGLGELIHKKPVSFQTLTGRVDVNFKKLGKNTYGFAVGHYDKVRDLIIEPLILYLGKGGKKGGTYE